MKQIILKNSILLIGLFLLSACVDVNVPAADASFEIQKDTIIDGKKARVQVTQTDTINPIYFVYKGVSSFNSVWPGDKVKSKASIVSLDTTYVNGKRVIKKKTTVLNYYISQDYDTRKSSLLLSVYPKKDTTITQFALEYQGVAIPFGSAEIKYTFKSKGNLTVTWISRNSSYKNTDEQISQKIIQVK